ncbi:MAG: rod shape-determining protein RodA [Polymorphobacter sp.]|uniref:rod shape-determining protein RodA n=1 Tax=Polymorphobacter sp. TaxID=1909290 RepID=UPI003A89ADF3
MFNGPWARELARLPWSIVLLITAMAGFGMVILYSAGDGSMEPWALRHGIRFAVLGTLMLLIAQVNPDVWLRYAFAIYAALVLALFAVELIGQVGGGSQRWLDLGVIQLQPSELMKIGIVLATARYYHYLPRGFETRPMALWPPLLLIGVPTALVMLQPDLGTALSIMVGGVAVMFLAGVRLWLFGAAALAALAAAPLAWSMLHDYQQRRVMIFLDPSIDPRGAGYHITQSKIAIGSGGLSGKGFLDGTQSHLEYLPELHTDFIFATMAEEWGLLGGLAILLGFAVLLGWGLAVAMRAATQFERLMAAGLVVTLFFYVAVNMMMVMGLAPVVGIPLPLISYGGSAMLTVCILLGLIMGVHRKRLADRG